MTTQAQQIEARKPVTEVEYAALPTAVKQHCLTQLINACKEHMGWHGTQAIGYAQVTQIDRVTLAIALQYGCLTGVLSVHHHDFPSQILHGEQDTPYTVLPNCDFFVACWSFRKPA